MGLDERGDWRREVGALYAKRGLGGQAQAGSRPAVIVVDLSRAFTDPSHIVGSDQADSIEWVRRLVEVARSRVLPVIYTTLAFPVAGGEVLAGAWGEKVPALKALRADDPQATEIDARVAPKPSDIVINKTAPSAFFGTGLVSILTSWRVDTVVVTGCSTSGCIRATAVDAVSYGFRVVVPAEAVADRAPEPHMANLFDIQAKYANVVPATAALEYLSRCSASRAAGA